MVVKIAALCRCCQLPRYRKGRVRLAVGVSQTYLHLAVLADYTALDLMAVVKKEGNEDPVHLLAFAQAYQV